MPTFCETRYILCPSPQLFQKLGCENSLFDFDDSFVISPLPFRVDVRYSRLVGICSTWHLHVLNYNYSDTSYITTHFTDMCIPHFFSLPNGVRRSTFDTGLVTKFGAFSSFHQYFCHSRHSRQDIDYLY
jgi:hypothetical protein